MTFHVHVEGKARNICAPSWIIAVKGQSPNREYKSWVGTSFDFTLTTS